MAFSLQAIRTKLPHKRPASVDAPEADALHRDSTPSDIADEASPKKKKPRRDANKGAHKKVRYPRKSRFVLLIGDEGAILIHMKGDTVLSRQFVPDASPGHLEALRETIVKDPLAPITMIIDSMDQSFVQQTLPPVSSLSVQRLIKRRLDRDFKPSDIKGAMVLGREKEGRKDWNFLMISVDKSPQMILWLEFVMTFPNRFQGIVLLSVEAAIVVKNLERSLGIATKSGTSAEWKILISHNKVGGFRQIVLRNDRLVFTRLAVPVGEPQPAVIAGHIEQEMKSTIEYLKRFGYSQRSGLDLYLLASEDVCATIDLNTFDAHQIHCFSPHRMALQLGLKEATQPTDQFGDVVLAASVGSITKNILKLTTVESRLFDKLQQLKIAQRLGGTFMILGLIVYLAYGGYALWASEGEVEDAKQRATFQQNSLAQIKKQVENSKINMDSVVSQIELYRELRQKQCSPLPFFMELFRAIKSSVIVKGAQWGFTNSLLLDRMVPGFVNFTAINAAPPPAAGAPPASDMIAVTLSVEFPVGLKSLVLFQKFADDFLTELHEAMPDYSIAYTEIPAEYIDNKNLQINFEQQTAPSTLGLNPVMVTIVIRGRIPTHIEELVK